MTSPRNRVEDSTLGQIRQVAEAIGYLTFHVYDSRRCPAGFPDLWILGFGKLVVLEIKAGKNTTTEAQDKWLTELRAAGVDARVYHVTEWRGRNLVDELTTAAKRWRNTGANRTKPDLNIDAIRLRLGRYNGAPNSVKAIALAADVPALLEHITWLTAQLEAVKHIAAGVPA